MAGAVFYYGPNSSKWRDHGASLFDAFDVIKDIIGKCTVLSSWMRRH